MGKKKDAAKLAALAAREAELAAELKRREKAAAKKAKSKGKKKGRPKVGDVVATMGGGEAVVVKKPKKIDRSKVKKAKGVIVPGSTLDELDADRTRIRADEQAVIDAARAERQAKRLDAARTVALSEDPSERKASPDADTDAAKARRDETDAEIKARVMARRAAREASADDAGSPERLQAMADEVKARKKAKPTVTSNVDKGGLVAAAEAHAAAKVAEAIDAIGAAVEQVETEHGREFVAGSSVATAPTHDFAKPSEAPRGDFEVNGNGQYLVQRPSDGKLVGYTRVTSYIKGIEDASGIEKWKMRVLLEGVAAVEEQGDTVTAKVRDLVHVRDVAIAKARKADRKGKLEHGELATYVDGAWRDFKRALDTLADDVFEIGGGREKAAKGTDLHALFELHDTEGMQAVADLATVGQITPADLADVEAYAALLEQRGIRIVDVERVVVNDSVPAPTPSKPDRTVGVAGRLDRTAYVKLPGESRARKRVLDVKTGSLEYSAGEIARQLAMYASADGYDLNTHEREKLGLDQRIGIVIHLPAGSATATLHTVDLALGRKGLAIIRDVRNFRNVGKSAIKPIDFSATAE